MSNSYQWAAGKIAIRAGWAVLLALAIALVVYAITGPRSVSAAATTTGFSPASVSLGQGESATITVQVTGLDLTADSHQLNIQHSAAFTVTNVACTGIFSGATKIDPSAVTGGTTFGCFFVGSTVSGADGAVGTFLLTRVGAGNETITIGIDSDDGGSLPAGKGTKFVAAGVTLAAGGAGTSSAGTLSGLAVSGFGAPGAPTGVTAVSTRSREVDLTWTAPASADPAVTDYQITASPADVSAFNTGSAATSRKVTGLNDGTAYTFTIKAINAAGTSTASTASNAVTPTTTVADPPTGLAVAESNQTVTVSWTAPAYSGQRLAPFTEDPTFITAYEASAPGQTTQVLGNTFRAATFTGLTNGQALTFSVKAINSVGSSTAATISGTPFTAPDAPTINSVTPISQGAITSVTEGASNGRAITAFRISVFNASSPTTPVATSDIARTAATQSITFTDSAILNGVTHFLTVAGVNLAGAGPSATSSDFIPVGKPAAPTGVTAAAGDQQITVSWTAVTTDANGNPLVNAVTSYTVTVSPADASPVTVTGSPPAATATITGLTNGTAYTATVTATNSDGTSDASSPSSAVTPVSTALASVSLNATSITMGSGATRQLIATPLTADGDAAQNVSITWSVVSGPGTVSSDGLYTAGTGPATTVVRATATQSGTGATVTADVTITIRAPAPAPAPTPAPENPSGTVPPPPAPRTEGAGTDTITPEEGGSASTADGNATVTVRPGSTDTFVAVEIAPVAAPDVPPVPESLRFSVGSTVVDLTFLQPDGTPISNFRADKSVTVSVKYTDADAAAAGGAENLSILKFESVTQSWVALATTVDQVAKTISAQVQNFSLFAVGIAVIPGVPTPTPTPTPVPPTPTPVPPTPTPTPVPPTPTPTPTPELPPTGDFAPGTGLVAGIMALGALMVLGGSLFMWRRKHIVTGR